MITINHSLVRLLACLAMLVVALAFRADNPIEWDSWEYAARAIRGHSSSLALGRWWFVIVMRWSYQIGEVLFGLTALHGYLAMQIASAVMMAGALAVLMAWTYRLTGSRAAELLAAALVLPGPLIGVYASTVMTESMALLFATLAYWGWENALTRAGQRHAQHLFLDRAWLWALGGGLAFGIAVDVREPAILFCAWPIISCFVDRPPERWKLIAVAFAGTCISLMIGIVGAWLWSPRVDGYWLGILEWMTFMASERQRYPVNILENAVFFGAVSVAAMPVATVLMPIAVGWAFLRHRRLVWLTVAMVPYLIANLLNHTLLENPRFSIPFVWFVCPVVAGALAGLLGQSRPRLGAAVAAVLVLGGIDILIGWQMIRTYYFDLVDSHKRGLQALLSLPQQSAHKPMIVAGLWSPVAWYLTEIKVRDFEILYGGWSWPRGEVSRIVANHLRSGADVYMNLETSDALRSIRDTGEWDELLDTAAKYDWDREHWPLVRLLSLSNRPNQQ